MGQQDQQNHQTGSPIKVNLQHDLNWLLQSQPLMAATPEVDNFQPQDAFNQTHISTTHVHTYPAQPAYRLGKQFEDCVSHLFKSSPTHYIIARNIVIQTATRTLGELDIIYQNSRAQIVHLELAIKFYLLNKDGTQLMDFVGPAGHDRLDLKWDRLRQHQLPLSQTSPVLDFLQQQRLAKPTCQQLLLTGILFYAYENWQSTLIESIGLNPNHQRGWCRRRQKSHHQTSDPACPILLAVHCSPGLRTPLRSASRASARSPVPRASSSCSRPWTLSSAPL